MKHTKENKYLWIFILGVLLTCIPSIMAPYSDFQNSSQKRNYYADVEVFSEEQLENFFEEAEAINRFGNRASFAEMSSNTILEEQGHPFANEAINDPFTTEMTTFEKPDLLSESDVFGFLEIPKLGEMLPIYLGATTENLAKGVAQVTGTSLPTGGKSTHSVIAGHRGYYGALFFLYINQLKPGDYFYIHVLNQVFAYEVTGQAVIEPTDTSSLGIIDGADLVTLLSCTPYPTNRYRICIYGTRMATPNQKNSILNDPTALPSSQSAATTAPVLTESNQEFDSSMADSSEVTKESDDVKGTTTDSIMHSFRLDEGISLPAAIHKWINLSIISGGFVAIMLCLKIIRKNHGMYSK